MNEAEAKLHIERQLRNAGRTLMEDGSHGQRQHRDVVRELNISHVAQEFVERSECPLKKEVQKGSRGLLPVFREAHDILRADGILKGEDQLMTFCTVLFLKLFSELRESTVADDLLWSHWSAKPAEDLYSHVKHSVLPAVKRDYPSLDLQIKQINQPATLKKLAELLVPLELQDRQIDVKGAAFEFFLQVYQSNEDKRAFGEYYTPRNVVTTMVQLVDPQFGETVYDPFTGSGGILTQAFKHIAERMDRLLEDKANKERLRSKTVYGREITGNVTLAQMNMILTGGEHGNITKGDSLLESKECWDDARSRGLPFPETVDGKEASLRRDERERIKYKIKQYDVVITNMPFGLHANKDVHAMIGPLRRADSNVACVEHCIQSVKPGGRLCMIVPEGILTGPKYFKLRKYIYESGRVEDIVELPVGTFAPYFSGRSAIIYMYKHKSDCPQADPQTCGVQQKVRYFKISDFRSGTSVEKRERSAEALRRFLTTRGEPNAKDFYDISLSEQTRLVSKPFVQPELAMHPGFEWTRLGEVVEEVKEKFIAHRNQSSGIAKFSLKHKYEGLVESRDKRWPKESKLVPPGAFVYAPQNITSGAIALHKGNNPVAVSNSYVVFKIKESHAAHDPEYLFQVLQSSYFTQQLRDNQRGRSLSLQKFSCV